MFLSQTTFAEKTIDLAGLQEAMPAPIPLPVSHCLYEERKDANEVERSEIQTGPYRAVLGSLLYLAPCTRRDIATAVSLLAKFQSSPALRHWRAMKHVVRYVKGTLAYGLLYKNENMATFTAWTDAGWARDVGTCRSRTG